MTLPKLVFDALRTELRRLTTEDTEFDNQIKGGERKCDNGDEYCAFEFEPTALELVHKTMQHLVTYRQQDEYAEDSTPL